MVVRVISPKEAIFIHMEKTGGSSMQQWLFKNTDARRNNKHGSFIYAKKVYPDVDMFFTIIRNPYAREVSWYNYILAKTRRRVNIAKNNFQGIVNKKKIAKDYDLDKNIKTLASLEKGFDYFVRNNKRLTSQFINAQHCNIVLKIENIQEDFKKIQDYFQVYTPLPHVNKTLHEHYSEYYKKNEDLIEYVYKKYQIDFDTYGYSFEKAK